MDKLISCPPVTADPTFVPEDEIQQENADEQQSKCIQCSY